MHSLFNNAIRGAIFNIAIGIVPEFVGECADNIINVHCVADVINISLNELFADAVIGGEFVSKVDGMDVCHDEVCVVSCVCLSFNHTRDGRP